jgi:hypothetical protein
LRKLKAAEYACGISIAIVALGLYSYYVRELLASLALFTAGFFCLGLLVFGAFLLWYASVQVATWTGPASRDVVAFSRRLIAAYARP